MTNKGLKNLFFIAIMVGIYRIDSYSLDMPKLPFGLKEQNIRKAVGIGEKVIQAAKPMSDEEEVALGREISANLLARYGLYEGSPELVKYLNLVGKTLSRHSSRSKSIVYRFAILNSESVNAFAAPGGYVFVTKGAIKIMKDESELAGILAHEIAHIESRHIPKAIQKANLAGAGADIINILAKDKEMSSKIVGFSTDMLFKGYSRQDEKEADQMAVELLSKCGYSVSGLKNFIKTISAQKSDDNKFLIITRTHPNPEERLQTIDSALKNKNQIEPGVTNKERFVANTAGRLF